jgi:C4-dicarboxylate-binding protein DctP
VVDGQENPPAVVYGGGLGEVQKFYTLDEHVFGLHVILANEEWFQSLTPGHQQIIRDAAALMAWTENLQKTEGDWKFSAKLQDELGMEVHVSTPEEKAAFKEITQAPVLTFIREQVGDELVDQLLGEVEAAKAEMYQ